APLGGDETGDLIQMRLRAGGQHHAGAVAGQADGGGATDSGGGPGDQHGLVAQGVHAYSRIPSATDLVDQGREKVGSGDMNGQPSSASGDLANKIARLVDERGWNQEDFSRIANLNRQTVHQIMNGGQRKLRNATISACATALGLPVSHLKNMPLERLLPRTHQ